jgi:hypothetical protein
MSITLTKQLQAIVIASVCVFSTQVQAGAIEYKVKVTNLTRGQSFTPILAATHKRGPELFKLGQSASTSLAALAESGNTEPLSKDLINTGKTKEVLTSGGLLEPGQSRTFTIKAGKRERFLSMAAMLIPTNDAFMALKAVALPRGYGTVKHFVVAYDAGSEPNDEQCVNIPGPVCQGVGPSPDEGGEGYVHVHAGIHTHGDDVIELNAAERDWRNPVALVRVTRVPALD